MKRFLPVKVAGNTELIFVQCARNLDRIVARHTAFTNFSELIDAKGGYRPSIYLDGKTKQAKRELVFLVVRYNDYMKANNDARRIHQGDFELVDA
jgi:hypothetical protein